MATGWLQSGLEVDSWLQVGYKVGWKLIVGYRLVTKLATKLAGRCAVVMGGVGWTLL